MAIATANIGKNAGFFENRRPKRRIAILLPALASIGATILGSGCTTKPSGLAPLAEPFSRFLQGGGSHTVSVKCRAGDDILVRVAQDNIDVTLSLVNATSAELQKVDSPSGRFGDEVLVFACRSTGHESILIHSAAESTPGGRIGVATYSLAASPKSVTTAFRHLSEAGRKNVVRGDNTWASVIEDLSAAGATWKSLGMQREYALTEFSIAYVYYMNLTGWRSAAEHAGIAAQAFESITDQAGTAASTQLQGAALEEAAAAIAGGLEDPERARTYDASETLLRRAERQQLAQHRLFDAGMSRDYLALNYFYRGREDAAMAEFGLAEQDFAALKEVTAQRMVLQNIATINYENGSYAKAKSAFEALLPLMTGKDDPYLYATVLHNSALVLSVTGDFQNALQRELESLEIQKVRNSRAGQARSLYAIGIIYQRLAEYDRALEYLNGALILEKQEIAAPTTDTGRLANQRGQMFATLVGIGNVERSLHHYDAALNAHADARALAASDKSLARIELAEGLDLAATGRLDRALQEFDRARQRGTPNTNPYFVEIIVGRSKALRGEGKPIAGLDLIRVAQHLAVANDNVREQTTVSAELASLQAAIGDRHAALKEMAHAISLSDRLRTDERSPELRAITSASQRDLYRQWVNLLLGAHQASGTRGPPEATIIESLLVADRSNSRSLRERLGHYEVLKRAPSLTSDAQATFDELAGKRATLDSLLERDRPDAQRIGKLRGDIALLQAKADLVNQQRDGTDSNSDVKLIKASSAQALMGEMHTPCAIVEYLLTDDSSWVWAVGRNHVGLFRLPNEFKINSMVQNLRRSLQTADTLASWQDAADALASAVLKPALAGNTSSCFVIIPDGALHYVPFSLLASRLQSSQGQTSPVSIAPSFQVIADSNTRGESPSTQSSVAIFAAHSSSPNPATAPPELQALNSEVRAIQIAFGTDHTYVATPTEATRAGIMRFDFSPFSVVHIATHGSVDSSNGLLSRLSFGNANDSSADLRAYDVPALHLNASLVVLSACDSGLGQFIDGEGLVGFVNSFIGAGAHSVLMSLWKVPDGATAQLMAAFYRVLKRENATPEEALSVAQHEMASSPKWGKPFYWAGFEVVSTHLPNMRRVDQQ